MSKRSRAWSRSGMGNIADPATRRHLKAAFNAGWDARDSEANHRIAALARQVQVFREALETIESIDLPFAERTGHELTITAMTKIARRALAESPGQESLGQESLGQENTTEPENDESATTAPQ